MDSSPGGRRESDMTEQLSLKGKPHQAESQRGNLAEYCVTERWFELGIYIHL